MVNWSSLVNTNEDAVVNFALGKMSGRRFYDSFRNTDSGGVARMALRKYGVSLCRRTAKKAMKRRALI